MAALSRGSTGAAVKDWQSWLNAQGFSAGAVDGIFGPQTEAAVKRFQSAARITADGVIGPATWIARANWKKETTATVIVATTVTKTTRDLMIARSKTYKLYWNDLGSGKYRVYVVASYATAEKAAAIITAETGFNIYPQYPAAIAPGVHRVTLRRGSTGAAVKDWQSWLNTQGFSAGAVDGIFGPQTEAAVKRFQGAARITADGVIGPATWIARDTWAGVPGVIGGFNFAKLHHEALILARRGVRYVYGAEVSPAVPPESVGAMDCSEMVEYLFARAGFTIPDGSINQYHASSPIGNRNPELGDLGFQGSIRSGRVSTTHVVLVLSENTVVEAVGGTTRRVKTTSLSSVAGRTTFLGWRHAKNMPHPHITEETPPTPAPPPAGDETPGNWGMFEPVRKLVDRFLRIPLVKKINDTLKFAWENRSLIYAEVRKYYAAAVKNISDTRAALDRDIRAKYAATLEKIFKTAQALSADILRYYRAAVAKSRDFFDAAVGLARSLVGSIWANLWPVIWYVFGPLAVIERNWKTVYDFFVWLKTVLVADVKAFFRDPVAWLKNKFLTILYLVIGSIFEALCWFAEKVW